MAIVLILSGRNLPAEIPITLPARIAPVFTNVPVNGKPFSCDRQALYRKNGMVVNGFEYCRFLILCGTCIL
jgi:hypothetical protein